MIAFNHIDSDFCEKPKCNSELHQVHGRRINPNMILLLQLKKISMQGAKRAKEWPTCYLEILHDMDNFLISFFRKFLYI